MKKFTNDINTIYSDNDLTRLLDNAPTEGESTLTEDLLIQHENGDRSCLNWDLRGKGYIIVNQNEKCNSYISDAELLASAYRELETNKYKKY